MLRSLRIGGIRPLVHRLAKEIFAPFAPPRCRSCRAPLYGHDNPYLCAACAGAVSWLDSRACRGCGFPAGPHATHAAECFRCHGGRLRLTGAVGVARYRAGARELVLSLKFRGETELAAPMGELMAERFLAADFIGGVDAVLPVALHPARRRRRGFDQAWLLAERVSVRIGVPAAQGVLRRTVHTKPQAMLRRHDRLVNVTGAFVAAEALAGKRVLLVDDVMTTGATMAECARACRQAGATRVYALVFAR